MLCVKRGVFVFLHREDEDSVMSFAQPGTSVFLPAVFSGSALSVGTGHFSLR